MKREHFVEVVEVALDSLPQEFRSRIRNVAVLVEDKPPRQRSPATGQGGPRHGAEHHERAAAFVYSTGRVQHNQRRRRQRERE